MKTWTVDEMLSHSPCPAYPRERLESLWAGRPELSVRDIAQLDIPIEDRIWALLTDGPHVAPARERIVRRAIEESHSLHCGVPAVEQWAARWLSGDDRSREAPEMAAWEAARADSWATAEAAVWAAMWAAGARTAARAAWVAAAAAGEAERERQLTDILEVVDEQEGEQ